MERTEYCVLSTAASLNYKLINDYYIYKNIYLVYIYNTVIGNAKTHEYLNVDRQFHFFRNNEREKKENSNARDRDRERV